MQGGHRRSNIFALCIATYRKGEQFATLLGRERKAGGVPRANFRRGGLRA